MGAVLEPKVVWLPGEMRHEIHLTGDDTDGAFCLFIDFPPGGWRLPPHRHLNETETIHILEGQFDMIIGGEEHLLGPGETIQIPRGAPHTGGNVGLMPGKRIVVFSPAGPEGFFAEIGTNSPDKTVELETAIAAAARYGFVLIDADQVAAGTDVAAT